MRILFVTFLTWLPALGVASSLVGVSTLPGFLCVHSQHSQCHTSHPRPILQSSLPSLLQHLSSRTTESDLPLEETSAAPELVVLVASRKLTDPSTLVDRISAAVKGASSFQATTDRHASESDLLQLNAYLTSSIDELSSIVANDEAHILQNGVSEVVRITAAEEDEALFDTLRRLAERTSGKLAVIWTTRDDVPENAAPPDVPPEKKDDQPEDPKTETTGSRMNAPEINSAQLTGLLVALLFLIIFIPGFMCLWNIQAPQTFEIFDSNDVKKKIQ